MELFKRSFYIFSVDISFKISQRQPPQSPLKIRHEERGYGFVERQAPDPLEPVKLQ